MIGHNCVSVFSCIPLISSEEDFGCAQLSFLAFTTFQRNSDISRKDVTFLYCQVRTVGADMERKKSVG